MHVNSKINDHPGRLLVIEGLDGSGKSTQARLLSESLRRDGWPAVLSSEPTSGPVGSVIRQAITNRLVVDSRTLAALFAADRLDHVYNPTNGILKHLADGIIEVCDRYVLTSYAYQTQFVDPDWVYHLNSQVIRPDLTIFLDVDPAECYRRLTSGAGEQDLFHDEAHLSASRRRYLAAIDALRLNEAIVVLDANRLIADVHQSLHDTVTEFLQTHKSVKPATYGVPTSM